jgi:hypothetical protein
MVNSVAEKIRKGDTGDAAALFESLARIAPAKYHRETFRILADRIKNRDPFAMPFLRMVRELDPHCLQKLLQNLFVNFMVVGRGIRDRKKAELGIHLPNFMVISPTMKCNLACKGCYAGEYDQTNDLPFHVLDRIINEGKDMGMYFYTLSGGEVLLYEGIFDIFRKHNDCYFQFYTNGTLLTQDVVDRLAEVGNVAPMISVEGTKERGRVSTRR